MAFNINNFKQNVSDYGYLYTHSFEMYIATPQVLFNALINQSGTQVPVQRIAQNLKLRIDQIRAPGMNIMTADINRYGIGTTQKMPINSQFQEINFSIILDEFGEIWQYWYQWLRAIHDFSGTEGNGFTGNNNLPSYELEYKERYSTVMQIVIYDHYGNSIQKINLYEAFPTGIREVPLSWGSAEIMKMNVSVAYTSYNIVGSEVQQQPIRPASAPSRATRGSQVNISP